MTQWQELMQRFHLEEAVDAFVRAKVRDLVAGRQDFSFRGGPSHCSSDEAHPPHVVGHYDTVRFGALERFCLGREGHTPEGCLTIVVTGQATGDAAWPATAQGYWWVTPTGVTP